MVLNVSKWFKMVKHGGKWSKMVENGPKGSKILQKMVPNFPKIVLNGLKWSNMVQVHKKIFHKMTAVGVTAVGVSAVKNNLVLTPVIGDLSARNNLPVTHSDTASYAGEL